jgi:hypothetical protein
MFGFKKIAILAVTLASLAIPSLALADDHDRGDYRNDDRAVAQLRADIQRDRIELQRDRYEHRWADARRDQREIDAREAQMREMLRHRHGR